MEAIVVVELENQRNLPGVLGSPGLEEAQRRGVGVAPGLDG
jgi:hypothetical protein